MLKGHVFDLQTFTSEAFALFIDKFLDGKSGVVKGCSLSNTTNTATIGSGFFVIGGRFLEIVSSETISNISTNGYYSLVCEIDLSKTNTANELNQATIKTIFNSVNFPILTQQNINDGGNIYQFEFAKFKVEDGRITEFLDKRVYIDFDSIYTIIENTLESLEDQSDVLLKSVGGTLNADLQVNNNFKCDNISTTNRSKIRK